MNKGCPSKSQLHLVRPFLYQYALLLLFLLPLPTVASPFHVEGPFIRDEDGRVVFLHGVNIGQKRKRPPYRGWYGKAEYEQVGKVGFNVVRLLMSWAALEPEPGKYNEAYIQELKERVEWIASGGAYVLLDMHQDLFGEGFGGNGAPLWACDKSLYEAHKPRSPWWLNYFSPQVQRCFDTLWTAPALQDHLIELWRKVASIFAEHTAVIGFDLINEPHWGSYNPKLFEKKRLQPLYEKVMLAIRGVAKDKLIFVEPIVITQLGMATSLEPFGDKNIVFAPHYYHPLIHEGGRYDGNISPIRSAFSKLQRMAKKLGLPWWLGEFGGPTKPSYLLYFQHIATLQDEFQIGGAYWVFEKDPDDWFGILDEEGQFKNEMLDILLRPHPRRVAGKPLAYRYDFNKRLFTLSFEPDHTIKKPTILFLDKSRHYPEGFAASVEGGTWQYNPSSRQLLIWPTPDAKKVVVSVRPTAKVERVGDIEIKVKKRVRLHLRQTSFAGTYVSILFEKGYDPPCITKSIFSDGRPYCVFAFRDFAPPRRLREKVLKYLTGRKADLGKISQIHVKLFYQAIVDAIADGGKQVDIGPVQIELWSEANFFPDGKESFVGYPARNLKLTDVWVEASAGFPYYDTDGLKRAHRIIGSLDTRVFFKLTSQLSHQFLLLETDER